MNKLRKFLSLFGKDNKCKAGSCTFLDVKVPGNFNIDIVTNGASGAGGCGLPGSGGSTSGYYTRVMFLIETQRYYDKNGHFGAIGGLSPTERDNIWEGKYRQ